jgi:hypothetical protein
MGAGASADAKADTTTESQQEEHAQKRPPPKRRAGQNQFRKLELHDQRTLERLINASVKASDASPGGPGGSGSTDPDCAGSSLSSDSGSNSEREEEEEAPNGDEEVRKNLAAAQVDNAAASAIQGAMKKIAAAEKAEAAELAAEQERQRAAQEEGELARASSPRPSVQAYKEAVAYCVQGHEANTALGQDLIKALSRGKLVTKKQKDAAHSR